ncbi:glycosyltransferase family 2 protein [Rickettsia endosymbiont of Halotydeus destructor]|uniref:glycosyltransferase family 2 protein n=1 Tax=Rickettsia endosymbiont of Halotydeus destructor TaxID=2996754 RepID=UPI003BAE9E5E
MMHLKLSILLVSYNNEKYIREAIDSILMQQLAVAYEIVVADDCSTDNTRKIIEEYQLQNDNIIVLNSSKNLGITKNYQRAFRACKGEYIAVLEGDDYWTSPFKLLKQMEFLDNHQECSFCYNRFIRRDQFTGRFSLSDDMSHKKEILVTADLISHNFIGNFSTCMYRKKIIEQIPDSLFEMEVYDWMFNIVNSQYGLIGYLKEPMSIYRIHKDGVWSQKTQEKRNLDLLTIIPTYNKFLNYKFDNEFNTLKIHYSKTKSISSIYNYLRINGWNLCMPRLGWIIIDLMCPPIIYRLWYKYFRK